MPTLNEIRDWLEKGIINELSNNLEKYPDKTIKSISNGEYFLASEKNFITLYIDDVKHEKVNPLIGISFSEFANKVPHKTYNNFHHRMSDHSITKHDVGQFTLDIDTKHVCVISSVKREEEIKMQDSTSSVDICFTKPIYLGISWEEIGVFTPR